MTDDKNQRRQRNAEAGALGKLTRSNRQSAMLQALQSVNKPSEAVSAIGSNSAPPAVAPTPSTGHPVVYPTKGHRWVDPKVCQPWRLADRPENETIHVDELVISFANEGQVAPAIVRPFRSPEQPDIRYEIIAGQVRWRAALKANQQLLVDIRPDLDDHTAFRIMAVENDKRRDLSDYAKALRYRRALEEGLYGSRGELAESMGLSNSQLSKYLGFAELPEKVAQQFQSVATLPLTTGYLLAGLCRKGYQEQVMALVPRFESGEIAGRQLEELATYPEQLVAMADQLSSKQKRTTQTIQRRGVEARHYSSSSGRPLFSIRLSANQGTVAFSGRLRSLLEDESFISRLQALVEDAERIEPE